MSKTYDKPILRISSANMRIPACIIGCTCKLRMCSHLIRLCLQVGIAQIAGLFRVYQAGDFASILRHMPLTNIGIGLRSLIYIFDLRTQAALLPLMSTAKSMPARNLRGQPGKCLSKKRIYCCQSYRLRKCTPERR